MYALELNYIYFRIKMKILNDIRLLTCKSLYISKLQYLYMYVVNFRFTTIYVQNFIPKYGNDNKTELHWLTNINYMESIEHVTS